MLGIRRRAILASPLLAVAGPASAQTWPERPVRFVTPFAADAGLDATARLFGRFLEQRWDQPVVIENRTGAAGNIGAETVARAAPDGLTLLVAPAGLMTVNPSLYPNLRFSIADDLAAVAMLGTMPNVMVVPASSLWHTIVDFRTGMDTAGRPVLFGSAGAGSLIHISGELFMRETGLHGEHVPYRGSAPALADLMAGRIDVMFENQPGALPLIRDGRLRALAVTTATRSKALPNVPTTAEAGLPSVLAVPWFALFAPKGTPAEICARIAADVAAGQQGPAMMTALDNLGLTPDVYGPAALTALVAQERQRYGAVVRSADIRVE